MQALKVRFSLYLRGMHGRHHLITHQVALEEAYAPSRSTFDVNASQAPRKNATQVEGERGPGATRDPLFLPEETEADADFASSQPPSDAQQMAPEMPNPAPAETGEDGEDEGEGEGEGERKE